MLDMYLVNTRATRKYVVEPSSERVVLFRSDESGEADLGWSHYVADVRVIKIPGDHYDVMEPGRVEVIARLVSEICHAERLNTISSGD
jgi:thioesterase domain-containing protein